MMVKHAWLCCAILLGLVALVDRIPAAPVPQGQVLVEAEAFQSPGGWMLDQEFMDQMGSPYLLAHGLGEPVNDAETTVKVEKAGTYRLWVRTKDWVAQWSAPGAPGKFQVLVDGKAAPVTFGTEGAEWHWQDGGKVDLPAGEVKLALHDLTGFEGRCDAILFCADPAFNPPNDLKAMAPWRREALGLPEKPEEAGSYDLVVVGGGYGGMCAAISAARLGIKVALVQDRPILGGNASSEIHVGPQGTPCLAPYPRVGDVVRELTPDPFESVTPAFQKDPLAGRQKWDRKRAESIRGEKNITLLLNYRVNEATIEAGQIRAIVAQNIIKGKRIRLAGKLFADCTGDGNLGALAGAQFEMSLDSHMGPTNSWKPADTGKPAPFPRCPWALDLSDKPFLGREAIKPSAADTKALAEARRAVRIKDRANAKPSAPTPTPVPRPSNPRSTPLSMLGGWQWESGCSWNPITEAEAIRDWNFRAMYGAWDALKNVDHLYPTYKLATSVYLAGKRESRRLLGDVILTEEDFRSGRKFEDGCFPCTWSIDIHYPDKRYQHGFEGKEFLTTSDFGRYPAPYWVPYRCLYSRNVANLFMAGRDISVTHMALGPVRVMQTLGMGGEVVGMAASLCIRNNDLPRDVYTKHLAELKALMTRGAGKVIVPDAR